MAQSLTPQQAFLAPLIRLCQRHPEIEGQAIWWEDGAWVAQDDADDMIDGEEIPFYAEGLLAEGFGLHWQVLADAEVPKEPLLVRLFLWQAGETAVPPLPETGWLVSLEARQEAA